MKSVLLAYRRFRWTTIFFIALTMIARSLAADQVRVTQRQGDIHAFLLVKDENGKEIAVGDETNRVRGNIVDSRTVFKFLDGSVDDEETVYRQGSTFELIRDHHIQKGPSFPKPSDVTIDVKKGEVSWVETTGAERDLKSQHMDLRPDLANGMVPLLIENLPHSATELKVSYLAVASKPRIVTLDIKADGNDKVDIGPDAREADRFNIHTDIGGIAGVVAPIVGKQPPDIKLWVAGKDLPVFVRMDAPLYEEGPIWTVLLSAPSWPTEDAQK